MPVSDLEMLADPEIGLVVDHEVDPLEWWFTGDELPGEPLCDPELGIFLMED